VIYNVYCFACSSKYEQVGCVKPDQCGACGSARVGVLEEAPKPRSGSDSLGNLVARSGYDRCTCGCKYFEHDCCIDCGKHVEETPTCPAEGCAERCGGGPCWEHEKR
jgi:hypothetical protein